MKISEEVILDLLPVYFSGEASKDTQILVETYFHEHPNFAKQAKALETKLAMFPMNQPESDLDINKEKEIVMKVKRILWVRSVLFGLALFCSVMPFSMAGNSEEGLIWMMLRDTPWLAVTFGISAITLWGAYAWTYQMLQENDAFE